MIRRLALILPLGALVTALAGATAVPAAAGDPCFHSPSRPPVTDDAATQVGIADCSFHPTIARVDVGAEVLFVNGSIQPHEVVGANLTWGAHDKLLQPGDSIGWSFDEPGVYPYSCMIHPGMTGAIVVGDGSSQASAAGIGAGSAAAGQGDVESATAGDDESSGGTVEPLAVAAALVAGALVAGLLGAMVAIRRTRAAAPTG
jgi:plastocyanin